NGANRYGARAMGRLPELSRSGIPLVALEEDPTSPWERLQGNHGRLFVADETEKIDKYVSELPDNIYGSVKASKPKTLDETI
nr:hypothetical protein [Tanacetum cinerariifolium]